MQQRAKKAASLSRMRNIREPIFAGIESEDPESPRTLFRDIFPKDRSNMKRRLREIGALADSDAYCREVVRGTPDHRRHVVVNTRRYGIHGSSSSESSGG